ncbi:MAG TPA: hypothetical protein VHA74_02290 [Candidatus Dojkabacteria bacterium]|nr:hypothetical protein [Candidatus Dojkabacteria bacterium]
MKIEKYLKENLKTSVVIDESFKSGLLTKLTQKNSNKLTTIISMLISTVKKFFWVGLGSIATLAMLVVGFFAVDAYYPHIFQLNKNNLAKVSIIQGTYKVNSEDVKVGFRYVAAGDRVTLGDNSIAQISSQNMDVYMNSGSKVVINNLNGELFPYVEYGTVVISSASGVDKTVRAEVGDVNVYIKNGSAMATQNVEKKYSAMNNFFKNFVKPAYASDTTNDTEIVGVSGEVTVKKDSQEVKLDEGSQVGFKGNKFGGKEEVNKDNFNKVFCDEVVKEEKKHKKNTGTLGDLVAPVVSEVTPLNGTTVKTGSVTVSFVSNEDGWYNSNGHWKEVKANVKVSFEKNLTPNKNEIVVIVKDKAYNKTFVKINVNYDVQESVKWTGEPVANNGGVLLSWKAYGAAKGDKYFVFRNGEVIRIINVNGENKSKAKYYDTDTKNGVTYKYEIKLKRHDEVIADTTLVAVTAKTGAVDSSACKISLFRGDFASSLALPANYGGHFVKVEWSVSGSECPDHSGFKVVWNQTGLPVYPGSSYEYISDNSARSNTIYGLSGGTWYVRVCLYRPDTDMRCTNYSNQISVGF